MPKAYRAQIIGTGQSADDMLRPAVDDHTKDDPEKRWEWDVKDMWGALARGESSIEVIVSADAETEAAIARDSRISSIDRPKAGSRLAERFQELTKNDSVRR